MLKRASGYRESHGVLSQLINYQKKKLQAQRAFIFKWLFFYDVINYQIFILCKSFECRIIGDTYSFIRSKKQLNKTKSKCMSILAS